MKENIVKGLFAGIIAGVVATKMKSEIEKILPVRTNDTDSPPVVLADRFSKLTTEKSLPKEEKQKAEQKLHWLFGLAVAAIHGVNSEKNTKNTKAPGAVMGTKLYAATHGSILPALKTEPWPTKNKKSFVINEFIGHIAFGITTELVRKAVRKSID